GPRTGRSRIPGWGFDQAAADRTLWGARAVPERDSGQRFGSPTTSREPEPRHRPVLPREERRMTRPDLDPRTAEAWSHLTEELAEELAVAMTGIPSPPGGERELAA